MLKNYRSKVTCDRRRHETIRRAESILGHVRHEVHCTPPEFAVLTKIAAAQGIRLRRMRLDEAVRVLASSADPTAAVLLQSLDSGIVTAALAQHAKCGANIALVTRPVAIVPPSAPSSTIETDAPPPTKTAKPMDNPAATGRVVGKQQMQSEFDF